MQQQKKNRQKNDPTEQGNIFHHIDFASHRFRIYAATEYADGTVNWMYNDSILEMTLQNLFVAIFSSSA